MSSKGKETPRETRLVKRVLRKRCIGRNSHAIAVDTLNARPRAREPVMTVIQSSTTAAQLKTAELDIERCATRAGWFEPIGTIGCDVSSEAQANAMRGPSNDGDMV
jgi:hypothetical protein